MREHVIFHSLKIKTVWIRDVKKKGEKELLVVDSSSPNGDGWHKIKRGCLF
jgi:hypothetical protein